MCPCTSRQSPTICVLLVGVGNQPAVVPVIWHPVIVIVRVTGVTLAVVVVVSLVGIGDVRTVVLVVLVAVLIDVLVVVTLVSHKVIVHIGLRDRAWGQR